MNTTVAINQVGAREILTPSASDLELAGEADEATLSIMPANTSFESSILTEMLPGYHGALLDIHDYRRDSVTAAEQIVTTNKVVISTFSDDVKAEVRNLTVEIVAIRLFTLKVLGKEPKCMSFSQSEAFPLFAADGDNNLSQLVIGSLISEMSMVEALEVVRILKKYMELVTSVESALELALIAAMSVNFVVQTDWNSEYKVHDLAGMEYIFSKCGLQERYKIDKTHDGLVLNFVLPADFDDFCCSEVISCKHNFSQADVIDKIRSASATKTT